MYILPIYAFISVGDRYRRYR